MASTPKKARIGDAPAVNEQPSVEEMPVADGDPPVDESRFEEEPSSGVPLARPPPRLPPKGRAWLQIFMAKEYDQSLDDEPLLPVRSLLVNRAFLDTFFDAEPFGAVKLLVNVSRLVALAKCIPVAFAKTPEGVATLIHLAQQLTAIEVSCVGPEESSPVDVRFMAAWMRVAAKLRALPALSAITLITRRLGHPHADFFVHSLPDCVTHLNIDNLRIATLFRKRAAALHSVEMNGRLSEHPYLADFFRLRSARIELPLLSADNNSFQQLHDCGPLDPNDHLQDLHIRGAILADDGVPQILRHLRGINEHFQLCCGAYCEVMLLLGFRDLKQLEDVQRKAKKFAAAMHETGFRKTRDVVWVGILNKGWWHGMSREELIAHFKWTPEGALDVDQPGTSMRSGSFVHEGVRVLMMLSDEQNE